MAGNEEVMRRYRTPAFRVDADAFVRESAVADAQSASGDNPLCGDDVSLSLVVRDGIVERAFWTGFGCSLSTASAEAVCELMSGSPVERARSLAREDVVSALGDVAVGSTRMKCLDLPLSVAKEALSDDRHRI